MKWIERIAYTVTGGLLALAVILVATAAIVTIVQLVTLPL